VCTPTCRPGNIITATVYDATGNTRGAVLAFASAASEAARSPLARHSRHRVASFEQGL
jgi:hypothetical protein